MTQPIPDHTIPEHRVPGEPAAARKRGLLVGAVVAALSLLLLLPLPWTGRAWYAALDLSHPSAFFAAYLLIAWLTEKDAAGAQEARKHPERGNPSHIPRAFVVAAVLGAFGILCEFLQPLAGRSPSVRDMITNGSGVTAGLFWYLGRHSFNRAGRIGMPLLGAFVLIIASWAPLAELHESYRQYRALPLLASFERPREFNAWHAHDAQITPTSSWSSHGATAMRVQGGGGSARPGANFFWPTVNAENYQALAMDLFNPGKQQLALMINISDQLHPASGFEPSDRFISRYVLQPRKMVHIRIQLSEIRVAPAQREMELRRLKSVNIIVDRPDNNFVFMVDNLRLLDD
ncbi:MAG: hypothetical protein HKN85_00315 [Gammaproteobacteria bacterium]|nr:hypothetical protein [Gammaproteobacteria bacterium]